METEPLFATRNPSLAEGLSPVLLAQSPERVTITTERGKEVPLVLTGYRLRMGGTYHLCVGGPAREIRLVGFNRYLVHRRGEPREIVVHGVSLFCQEFKVRRAGFWSMVTNLGIYPEELEVEVVLPDGRKVAACLPVVLELSFTWKLVLLLILWAMLGSVFELIGVALSAQRAELLTSPLPWIKGLCVALFYPLLTVIRRVWGLRVRARDLEQQFQRDWLKPEEEVV